MKPENFELRIAQLSDVHLGHHNTHTDDILANLRRDFSLSALQAARFNIFFIVGDLFDRLLTLPQDASSEISMWVNEFLRNCEKCDIIVRVLEGTPSHDWCQSRMFETENKKAQIGCDVKFIERLSIEYIERYDVNVLYVPDEHKPDNDDTWRDVCNLLAERGLDKVDFSLVHGTFEHQLPEYLQLPRHINQRYLDITRYFVLTGHIHKHSIWDRIVCTGSYDRIAHGEEHPKGHVRYVIKANGLHEIIFVENVGAAIYESCDCRGLSMNEAGTKIGKYNTYPVDANIRLIADKGNGIVAGLNEVRKALPHLNWTIKVEVDKASFKDVQQNLPMRIELNSITPDNIVELVSLRISNKNPNIDTVVKQRALAILQEAVNAARPS